MKYLTAEEAISMANNLEDREMNQAEKAQYATTTQKIKDSATQGHFGVRLRDRLLPMTVLQLSRRGFEVSNMPTFCTIHWHPKT